MEVTYIHPLLQIMPTDCMFQIMPTGFVFQIMPTDCIFNPFLGIGTFMHH